jgi:HEPN domain-containing protein
MESNNIILAKDWMHYVRLDLRWADFWDGEEAEITGGVAVLAEQAIEKSLKALLSLRFGAKIPKIHDLRKLYVAAKEVKNIEIDGDLLDELSDLYIVERYPARIGYLSNGDIPSLERAKVYLACAQSLAATVATEIEQAQAALALTLSTPQESA